MAGTCGHEKPYAGDCSGCLAYGWDSSAPLRKGYFRKGEGYCKIKRGEMTEEELDRLEENDKENIKEEQNMTNEKLYCSWCEKKTDHVSDPKSENFDILPTCCVCGHQKNIT